jgi:hypothetical protein
MTKLYRIENPNISTEPDGINSHPSLVWQWFAPDIAYTVNYLKKSQQIIVDRIIQPVPGVQLVVLEVPENELNKFHVSQNPTASKMDIEPDNFIVPLEDQLRYSRQTISLDDIELVWGNFRKLQTAKQAILQKLSDFWI